jgi:ABC-type transport system involved in multi-copper enzyme maturation permease subunit
MIVDFGVSSIYILQIFVAIFIGSMLIYREMERKTFFLIIPKPISREAIILGKCLGLTATITVVSLLSTTALCILLVTKGAGLFIFPILLSVVLSILESILVIFISLLFSGITSPILSAIFTFAFFLIGHSTAILQELIRISTSHSSTVALKTIYYILPNLEKFNIRNDIIYSNFPAVKSLLFTLLYTICYGIVLFFITRSMFGDKEF